MKVFNTDVLIVGAGPTGLVLSNLLGVLGVKNILIEKNSTTVQEPRAVSIDDEALRTLQAIGIINSVKSMIYRNYGSHYLSPSGRTFAVVKPQSKEYGFDKRNGFDQPKLEKVLKENLLKFKDTLVLFGHTACNIREDEEFVYTDVKRRKGELFTIRSKYTVGCDGANSFIRKKLGIALDGSSFAERWLIVDLFETNNRFRHTQLYCDSRRPCITLPGPNGIRRYEFKLRDDECEEDTCDDSFVRTLLQKTGFDLNSKIRRKTIYKFHALVANRWRGGSIFLAGDAAHISPPFAGQGMNSGLRDAHNLSWKLAYAINYKNSKILESYEQERKSHVRDIIHISLLMGKILAPRTRLLGFMTRLLFFLVSIYKPARIYLLDMRFKPKPYFEQGLLWKNNNKSKNGLVGRLFPQPEVEDTCRNRFLLDDLFYNKLVVLIYSEFPQRVLDNGLAKMFLDRGLAVVGLTPEWINPGKVEIPIVREVSNIFSSPKYQLYMDYAFLIRPDRYVAAMVPATSVHTFFDIVDRLQNKA